MFSCNRRLGVAGVAWLVIASVASAQSDYAILVMNSSPGDFVGQGGSYNITYNNISAQIRKRLPNNDPGELLFVCTNGTPNVGSALCFFGTDQLGIRIQPGTYPQARRADFAPPGFAGLDIAFAGRGSNQVFGSIVINAVTFDPGYTKILTFDADFVQRSESATAPPLTGRFTFNLPQGPTAPPPPPPPPPQPPPASGGGGVTPGGGGEGTLTGSGGAPMGQGEGGFGFGFMQAVGRSASSALVSPALPQSGAGSVLVVNRRGPSADSPSLSLVNESTGSGVLAGVVALAGGLLLIGVRFGLRGI